MREPGQRRTGQARGHHCENFRRIKLTRGPLVVTENGKARVLREMRDARSPPHAMIIEPNGAGSAKNPNTANISARERRYGTDDETDDGINMLRMLHMYCGNTVLNLRNISG